MVTRVLVLIACLLVINPISTAKADKIIQDVPPEEVTVARDTRGFATFSGDNIQYLTLSGEPGIPYHLVRLLLPPDVDPSSVAVWLEQVNVEELPDLWDVLPIPPLATWDGTQVVIQWPEGKNIVDGRDIDIYQRDALFPASFIGNVSTGQMRTWQMVEVPIVSHQYNPVTRKLYRLVEAKLIITFDLIEADLRPLLDLEVGDPIAENTVNRLTINFKDMAPAYKGLIPERPLSEPRTTYVIITTNDIVSNSSKLFDFVNSKEARGFDVEVVTEDRWGGGSGDTAAENIRSWLISNYMTLNIEYVLLIGNPHPLSGDVPMKMLWPRSYDTNHRESPSDYYYADLTGNWDLDGDGLHGEYDDDFGTGGVDRNWEVLVGRIPFYGDIDDLDDILTKIVQYGTENPADARWREKVLLAMKPLDNSTPGYHLGEAIKNDVLVPADMRYHRVYQEDYGLAPPPETTPTTVDNVTNVWNSSQFGAVFWCTHGWSQGAGSVMDLSHAATLDDSYPGFTFQASCSNSFPEAIDNLSYALLKNGGIGTVGATRVAWYWPAETDFAGSTSVGGMTYEYAWRLILNRMDSGHALFEMKQSLYPGIWMNFTVFNLYGDPEIGMFSWELANDAFAEAELLTGSSGYVKGTNIGATVEPGEPEHANVPGGASVWWRWTAPNDGRVSFDTFGSEFDTVLAVYTGNAIDELDEVASNDDTIRLMSLVDFTVAEETVYWIVVDGYSSATGNIVLNWTYVSDLVEIVDVSTGLAYTTEVAVPLKKQYIDRDYSITNITNIGGKRSILIRTANDDKFRTADEHLTLRLLQDAIVYVGYDPRATSPPFWLEHWTLTDEFVDTTDWEASPMELYALGGVAGDIFSLGGNHAGGDTGAKSHYIPIVQTAPMKIVYVSTAQPYVPGVAVAGERPYIDRTYEITGLSEGLRHGILVRTANDDKLETAEEHLTLRLLQDAIVYVGYDHRATSPPFWLEHWTLTDEFVDTTDGEASPMELYALGGVAGDIFSLGGNHAGGDTGAKSHYIPIIQAAPMKIANVSTAQPYVPGVAVAGERPYIDRTYEITELSEGLRHGILVRTANDDKWVDVNQHLELILTKDARLFVCYDGRATKLPDWLSNWTLNSETISTTDAGASPMRVYERWGSAGKIITLGGNHDGGDTGARSNYLVVIKE